MSNSKEKTPSNLIKAVTALDEQFSELSRLSIRIESADLKTDAKTAQMTDLEQEAHSLKQSLTAVCQKLSSLQPSAPL